jgi:hypothetical protein
MLRPIYERCEALARRHSKPWISEQYFVSTKQGIKIRLSNVT